MKRIQKALAGLMTISMVLSVCSCTAGKVPSGDRKVNSDASKPEFQETSSPEPTTPDPTATPTPVSGPTAVPTPRPVFDGDITNFTMFTTMYGNEKSDDNEIKKIIAEMTGVYVEEYWLRGQTESEAVDAIIASGECPDFIYTGSSNEKLYENDYLIAWDDYLEKYPNLKELYSEEQWDKFRQDDGHIYWADVFENYYGKDTSTLHNEQAFWIQVRVLEWAGYPKIETLDEYFDLIERYAEANPYMPNGDPVIPYTCLCEDWRYFCIESAPLFLDGYANNMCVGVSTENGIKNPKVVDYNTTETAKNYFKKLNEEYQKGIIDPDFAVQNYDEYISKICSGCVLGMSDQYWDFAYSAMGSFEATQYAENGDPYSLSGIGCDYVPLGLVAKNGMSQRYHTYNHDINVDAGIAISTSCVDPDKAFKFLSDLLDQDIHDLRFWGIEGVDYLIDENGSYYRTPEMRINWSDSNYKDSHSCEYSYMPQWRGTSRDGINCMMPAEQPSEYKASLPEAVVKCFDAYGVNNYVEFIGSEEVVPEPWYPLWTWSNNLTTSTPYGAVWVSIGECKHEWLPKLVMSKNFNTDWKSYMTYYEMCDPQVFLDAAQAEVNNRI